MTEPVIRMQGLGRLYQLGAEQIWALRNLDLVVQQGELLAIVGPSGSGKSTLMNLLGCLDRPTEGTYAIDGLLASAMNDDQLADLRNKKIGFVFQSFNLLPRQTAMDNVALPLRYSGVSVTERKARSQEALVRVELGDRMSHRPDQLSGGQKQRVAIARALVTKPSLLLADEPTGALDQRTGQEIIRLFWRLNQEGVTVILVTHDPQVAASARRVVTLVDGHVVSDRSS